jgi:hypothetical protein
MSLREWSLGETSLDETSIEPYLFIGSYGRCHKLVISFDIEPHANHANH